ncbi:MAG: 1-deoxy-D-xylulose-5-phosphate reductoisomerase [Lachnospiraceae bacterium]|nr:1-deoxy-D-xylulose-5-phosphate reductoisomerase [Lachnospiraceae bacterium]
MRKVAILGSTGSIGTQALEIVRANGDIQVTALTAARNIEKLEAQIREFKPRLAAVWEKEAAEILRGRIADLGIPVYAGMEGMLAAAGETDAQIVVTAVVGMIGILPTLRAIQNGKDIALANKETLVTAGHLIMPLAEEKQVRILPVDSEHSAIFQALNGENRKEIANLWITASGGPFLGRTREELKTVRLEDALKHPNWVMGKKITIDSSTLVNKGLEVMEARWLFGVPMDRIRVVIQPKSIIHSMVEFLDGAVMAQLGTPDMKLPIQYALYYPERRPLSGRLDFWQLSEIAFAKPDTDTFKGLRLAYEAGRQEGTLPTVFNAANEWAVARFLEGKIGYLDIADRIEHMMMRHDNRKHPSLEEILETEKRTCECLDVWLAKKS